jgi:hypothetical protein
MVYAPLIPVLDLSKLVCGLVMIIAATFSLIKIRYGSKNVFAYVLMWFTELLGFAFIGQASTEAFRNPVTGYANQYAYRTPYYL